MKETLKKLTGARWVSSLLFLIALFVLTGIVNPSFFTYSNIINCFNSSCVFMLLAIGISFTIMTGEIDVSVGAVMGLTAAIAGVIAQTNGSWLTMLCWAVLVGAVTGAINGLGVAVLKVPSLIFTLGTNGVLRGIIYIYTGGRTIENFTGDFTRFGNSTVGNTGIGVFFLMMIVIVVLSLLSVQL